ncbi:nucleotidyltransferase family protein [Methylomonas montana]|uniref:N-acetylmuramate alpha-1-phosphate uridylyltransferase MurU n=1 Tax=Methylomonas montana TaxID=3058963 RepID=UPI00265B0BC1|nr:nucleotidyltransferase family protein [Methylomonas montana]WKJ89362.1 nucleotidyltransferase family protein [Methylomonas montana]
MKAMILAAGRGERMRPLTDRTPKPLLKAAGKTLIEYNIENLVAAGFTEIIINIAHLGTQIKDYCGDGKRWNASITYSDEGETALETAGGIANALPLLGDQPFLVLNADIVCDFPLHTLRKPSTRLAHLVMIDNPPHHPEGDFALNASGLLSEQGEQKLTFSGIGVYHPDLFEGIPVAPLKLRPVLNQAIRQQRISGEKYSGLWMDIGTAERLETLAALIRDRSETEMAL